MARDHFSTSVPPLSCFLNVHITDTLLTDDEKWVEQLTDQLFDHKPVDQITPEDMLKALIEMKEKEPDCEHWTFGKCVILRLHLRPFATR